MAKIVHISDIHWRGIQRHDEYTAAFELLFEQVKAAKPDIIINTGDTFHTKTQGITPEIIGKLAWMFNKLAEIAPTFHLLGNHDGNLTNMQREDVLSPIHAAIKNSDSYLLKKSGTYKLDDMGFKFNLALNVFSVFDPDGWKNVKPAPGYINIALYHGSISGCKTDSDWVLEHGEQTVDFFKDFDFVMLGDIHKHQWLGHRNDIAGIKKPYIGYPGSLIQQNHGEEIKKGYLVWDIRANNDWDVHWQKLDNLAPFVTIGWEGSCKKTLSEFEELHGKYAYMPGTRYRITSSVSIPSMQSKELIEILKKHESTEITFKTDVSTNLDSFSANNMRFNKASLVRDPETLVGLYGKYIDSNPGTFSFDKLQNSMASNIIRGYSAKLNAKNKEFATTKNTIWAIKYFKWDNLYGYGAGNSINFEALKNIVGIFGPNRSGKSSILGALMYTLYNTTDRGSVKNSLVINSAKLWGSGEVRISVGDEDYVIQRKSQKVIAKRTGKDEGKSTTTVNLWRIENRDGLEVKVSANGITRDDTDRLIRKLIGTSDDFLLTAFASQENINMFISNKATKRKEILNRFLELDVFDQFYAFAKEDYNELNVQSKNYTVRDWANLIDKTESDIIKIDKEIEGFKEREDILTRKRDNVKLWISSHEKDQAAIDSMSEERLSENVANLENGIEINERAFLKKKKELREKKMAIKVARRKIDKTNIDKLREDLGEMGKLKEALTALKNSLKIEAEVHGHQEKAVRKLAVVPCGDKFPSCHFIKDGHEAKKTIAEQKKTVTALERGIKTTERLFDKFAKKNIQTVITEHADMVVTTAINESEQKTVEETIANLEFGIPQSKDALRVAKAKLKKVQKLNSDKLSVELQKKEEYLSKLNLDISGLSGEKNRAFISLGGKQDSLKKLLSEQDQGKDIIKRLKVYDSIQNAFSKNGIPAMVLQSQLPAINSEIARVLDGLVDFEVTMETDTTANIMDVYFHDEKGKRIVELCSGMEKTLCSMALRVALGNLSALARPDMLVLDESFGALDEDSLQTTLEMLSLLRGHFRSIFIITHITPIKEIADDLIEIRYNGTESKVKI